MSEEKAKVVRQWMEAWERGDRERVLTQLDALDPDIEWDASRLRDIVPDIAGIYHGPDGVRRFWSQWLSPWREIRFESWEVQDAGDDVVLLVHKQRHFGRHSGLETEIPPYAWVFTFSGDLIVRGTWYPDQEAALDAAGVSK